MYCLDDPGTRLVFKCASLMLLVGMEPTTTARSAGCLAARVLLSWFPRCVSLLLHCPKLILSPTYWPRSRLLPFVPCPTLSPAPHAFFPEFSARPPMIQPEGARPPPRMLQSRSYSLSLCWPSALLSPPCCPADLALVLVPVLPGTSLCWPAPPSCTLVDEPPFFGGLVLASAAVALTSFLLSAVWPIPGLLIFLPGYSSPGGLPACRSSHRDDSAWAFDAFLPPRPSLPAPVHCAPWLHPRCSSLGRLALSSACPFIQCAFSFVPCQAVIGRVALMSPYPPLLSWSPSSQLLLFGA